jgi:flagellar M-ring protein FliF
VSIVDQNGNLLASGEGEDSSQFRTDTIAQYKQQYEQRLTRAIEELVGSTVGYGKVRATVNADVNFDRIQTNSEEFDPETQVARSTQLIEESEQSTESDQQNVGVANNLPGLPAEDGGAGQDTAQSNRVEEVTNFEISRTVTNRVREGGRVDKLSVAVLVDGNYAEGDNGEQQYQPRSEEEINQIESLVKSAIGFDPSRGDQLEVVNMRFADGGNVLDDAGPVDDSFFMGLTKTDLFRIGEMGMIGIVAILVILLVVRPMVQNLSEIGQVAGSGDQPLLEGQSQKALAGPAANSMMQADEDDDGEEGDQEMIDLEQIEGRVKASSVRKVSDIIDSHPGETVSVIRGWLFDEG